MTPCDDGLYYSTSVEPHELRQLLETIRAERCAHTWRNFAPDGGLEELLQWENELRPTTLFFYYCHEDAGSSTQAPRLAAAASVADAIQRDFPFAGFPILARCFVAPGFRHRGLYRRIVQHRLDFCRSRFQDGLKAIHLGTADPRVMHAVSVPGVSHVRFVQIGSQIVRVGSDDCLVGAFLHFTPSYTGSLIESLHGEAPPLQVTLLREAVSLMVSGVEGEHVPRITELLGEARATGWLDHCDLSALEQLLALCRAIPLIGLNRY